MTRDTTHETAGDTQPAAPIRVLVVDDSAYMRFTITKFLGEAEGLSVVAAAHDGREALELVPKVRPDVITLDVEMPYLDGLSALREIMAHYPTPVVMLSSLTTEGAHETVQALTWGAVDFVAKPASKANIASIMSEVIAKVRAAAQAKVSPIAASPVPALHVPAEKKAGKITRPLRARDRVVVVGSSTGGPRALNAVFSHLPADLQAAVLIVQHMPVGFTGPLAERLDSVSPLAIKEAAPGDELEVGRALLAPAGYHMTVDGGDRIALNRNPTVHGVRPAVDVTMVSIAQKYKAATVGVVLTGMGRDGTNGAALIHESGGHVIAEADSTCVVWGMPRAVVEAGVADEIAPLPEVAEAIERAVRE